MNISLSITIIQAPFAPVIGRVPDTLILKKIRERDKLLKELNRKTIHILLQTRR